MPRLIPRTDFFFLHCLFFCSEVVSLSVASGLVRPEGGQTSSITQSRVQPGEFDDDSINRRSGVFHSRDVVILRCRRVFGFGFCLVSASFLRPGSRLTGRHREQFILRWQPPDIQHPASWNGDIGRSPPGDRSAVSIRHATAEARARCDDKPDQPNPRPVMCITQADREILPFPFPPLRRRFPHSSYGGMSRSSRPRCLLVCTRGTHVHLLTLTHGDKPMSCQPTQHLHVDMHGASFANLRPRHLPEQEQRLAAAQLGPVHVVRRQRDKQRYMDNGVETWPWRASYPSRTPRILPC